MIHKIFSERLIDSAPLHTIIGLADAWGSPTTKEFISDKTAGLQIGLMHLVDNCQIETHWHNPRRSLHTYAEECWILLEGSVSVRFYDIDGKFLEQKDIFSPSLVMTIRGGHYLQVHSSSVKLIEVKIGPYMESFKSGTPEILPIEKEI